MCKCKPARTSKISIIVVNDLCFNPGAVTLPEILPANVPTKYPAVIIFPVALITLLTSMLLLMVLPDTDNDVNVPTLVMFGCALVVTVPVVPEVFA